MASKNEIMTIQCQNCEEENATAVYSVIWIVDISDEEGVENSSVYLCDGCAARRYIE